MVLENKKLETVKNCIGLGSSRLTFVAVTVYCWAVSLRQQFTLANSCIKFIVCVLLSKGKSFSEFSLLAWISI